MEAIATNAILLVQLVGNGIHESLRRHGLMEGGVEYAYLRQAGHQLLHSVHTLQVGGVMEGSQIRALLKHLQHLVGKDHALVELLATVHHAMTYGINLAEVFDYTNLRIGEQGEDELHAFGVLGNIVHDLLLLAIGQLHLHKGTI